MQKIVLASGNRKKVAELTQLLAQFQLQVIPQTDLNVEDVPETGTTFIENAIIKARHAAEVTGLPAIADDSGIEIDYLDRLINDDDYIDSYGEDILNRIGIQIIEQGFLWVL